MRGALCLTLGVLLAGTAGAHVDPAPRIEQLDAELAHGDAEAGGFVRRAELHRVAGHWDAAARDYTLARKNGAGLEIDLLEGRMWVEAGRAEKAMPLLDRFLDRLPDDVRGRVWRGRAAMAEGRHTPAFEDFSYAVDLTGRPTPDLVLEQVAAAAAGGHHAAARNALEAGVGRLGRLVVLIDRGITLARATGDHAAALTWWSRLAPAVAAQPQWLAVRGDILEESGDSDAAARAYRDALDALGKRPAARRETPAMLALAESLQVRSDRIGVR